MAYIQLFIHYFHIKNIHLFLAENIHAVSLYLVYFLCLKVLPYEFSIQFGHKYGGQIKGKMIACKEYNGPEMPLLLQVYLQVYLQENINIVQNYIVW
jgi:hypothetical protein